jgi:SAM-dependent methyltransferase
MSYYADKLESLKDLFGTDRIRLEGGHLAVGDRTFPIVDDVIILTDPSQYTPYVRQRVPDSRAGQNAAGAFAEDIQFTFGEEWQNYARILPEHENEFRQYFDIVDVDALKNKRVCDLGCGMGRWSYFLKNRCREIILIDFSDAIFEARNNLRETAACLFFMADLKSLPFRDNFCDFLFSLGVLHHLPTPCLAEVRALRRMAPESLVFLYYALDNRPYYFRAILRMVTVLRTAVSGIRSSLFRKLFSLSGTYFIYVPLIAMGALLKPFGLNSRVPLYDFYHDKSAKRIEQDVYDRFFTRIEQRVTRNDILSLKDTFTEIVVSDHLPYWHFLCRK